jgi:hypothetical protein
MELGGSSAPGPQTGPQTSPQASTGAAPNSTQPVLSDRLASMDTTAQSGTRADLAARLGGANSPAAQAAATVMQQNGSTVEGGAGTQGPPQQEQRQSGATQGRGASQASASTQQGASAGQGSTQAGASSGRQGTSVAQERAAAMAEHTRGQDKGIAQQKEQAQQKDMER